MSSMRRMRPPARCWRRSACATVRPSKPPSTRGIAYWINTQHPNFKDNDKKIEKTNPGVVKIKEHIDELFKGDRRNPLTKDEMMELTKKYIL